jgi:hypothetical protein
MPFLSQINLGAKILTVLTGLLTHYSHFLLKTKGVSRSKKRLTPCLYSIKTLLKGSDAHFTNGNIAPNCPFYIGFFFEIVIKFCFGLKLYNHS